MVENLVLDLLLSAFDFLRGSFILSIPVFLLFLLGYFFSKKFLEKFNLKWIQKTFVATYFVFILLLLVFFIWPVIEAFLVVDNGVIPEPLRMTLGEFLYLVFSLLVKMLVVAFILSLFVLPLAFIGVFVLEFFSEKFKWNKFINFFLSCFIATVIGLFVVLFLFPWVIPGIIYLVYFA
jgi:hypothetical protein